MPRVPTKDEFTDLWRQALQQRRFWERVASRLRDRGYHDGHKLMEDVHRAADAVQGVVVTAMYAGPAAGHGTADATTWIREQPARLIDGEGI